MLRRLCTKQHLIRQSRVFSTSLKVFDQSSTVTSLPPQRVSPPEQMKNLTKRINDVKDKARLGGGQKRLDKQHEKGRLTARERLEVLLDEGSFREYDMFVEHRYDRNQILDVFTKNSDVMTSKWINR
jgi:acetyl-CoA carboxylase beta subunit